MHSRYILGTLFQYGALRARPDGRGLSRESAATWRELSVQPVFLYSCLLRYIPRCSHQDATTGYSDTKVVFLKCCFCSENAQASPYTCFGTDCAVSGHKSTN